MDELVGHLQRSLAWAKEHSAFYKTKAECEAADISSIGDFTRAVPVIDKAVWVNLSDEFVDLQEPPVSLNVTGGTTHTTGASPLLIYSSQLTQLAVGHRQNSDIARRRGSYPICLHISNGSHGPLRTPDIPGVFFLSQSKAQHFDTIVHILERKFSFAGLDPSVTYLSGSINQIKVLTLGLIERGIPASNFAITSVTVGSYMLSQHWRERLTQYWGCPIVELYGLSEVARFIAASDDARRIFTYSGPVFLEVLAINNDAPATSGVGRLIATPLFPFSAQHPILRYDTGDLVEMIEYEPTAPYYQFKLLGRRKECVTADLSGQPEVILAAASIEAALSDFAEIQVTPYEGTRTFNLRTQFGAPRYELYVSHQEGKLFISIEVQLRYSPFEFPDAAASVAERLRLSVMKLDNRLAMHCASGAVGFKVRCIPSAA